MAVGCRRACGLKIMACTNARLQAANVAAGRFFRNAKAGALEAPAFQYSRQIKG